ncbi:MAG: hypothetical protein M5R40_08105 [Anaerolineae bacterium]|nr:hypothetical protein [Anaerolineae bacterium]
MMAIEERLVIGHVLRGSTTGFVCGTRINKLDLPQFGAFVEAPCGNGANHGDAVIGLIYAIHVDDDPLVRQLILADNVTPSTREDQRINRMVPVEISVINVGHIANNALRQALPPRPPLSLAEVEMCPPSRMVTFCQRFDFFRLVLNATELPADELLAASLLLAADALDDPRERSAFLVRAGRELARLLSRDLSRLESVLNLIRPAA